MGGNMVSDLLGDCTPAFAAFGAITAAVMTLKFLCSVCSGIKTHMLAKSLGLGANLKKMGTWAVVTGSTDGIGKCYAQGLAKLGMDVILISRTPEKLNDVATEIESEYKVKTKIVAVDFSAGPDIYKKIRKEIGSLDIGVLVNNVGMSYTYPERFLEAGDEKRKRDIITVNINSVVEMTQIVLPGMIERKRGAIINIASASAIGPTPMLTLYSATKAFVDFFSRALQTEYRSKGIIIQSVLPFFVATKLSGIRRSSFFVPPPAEYVSSALATVGVQERTVGCLSHALQQWFFSWIPESTTRNLTMKSLLAVGEKAKKRLAKSQ